MSFLGEKFDIYARQAGGWPDGTVVTHVEVIGGGDDPMVLLTGQVPIGVKRNGKPKFGTRRQSGNHKAGIPLAKYRELLA
jgi:hypothetical protein